ncbi:MAG: hypothetical protein ABW080_13900 [Candidatus Thiodiazotropha sp.]
MVSIKNRRHNYFENESHEVIGAVDSESGAVSDAYISPEGMPFPSEENYRIARQEYEDYLANGGTLSFQDWMTEGRPEAGQWRVVEATRRETLGDDTYHVTYDEYPRIHIFGRLQNNYQNGDMELTFDVRSYDDVAGVRVEGFYASTEVRNMFDYFGNRVDAVNNTYIADSLDDFNALIRSGRTLEEAAAQVRVGQWTEQAGFRIESVVPEGAPGNYTSVRVRFRRE